MRTTFTAAAKAPSKVRAHIVAVASDGPVPREAGMSRDALAALGFEAGASQTLVLPPTTATGPVRVFVGVGPAAKVDAALLRNAAAASARAAQRHEVVSTNLALAGKGDARASAKAVVEGMALALHRWADLKNDTSSVPRLTDVTLVAGEKLAQVRAGAAAGSVTARATCLARDLANTPPSHLTARLVAERAVALAAESGLEATVYNRDQLAAMGCGGIVGVNAGSTEPPRMVKLVWAPREPKGRVVLVGKGVMYDSGGISLKPSDGMHVMMKMDMSGAAAVLATMGALRDLKVRTHVTAYLMCTDNMPSGSALKLGDVLTMRNGKTVEVHNTDAEGRLILADGLSLGAEQKPDAMVDIATLTGACLAALGKKIAGVVGNSESVVEQLRAASARTDELLWELPLHRDYRKLLDSNVADMKNIGGPYAGVTTSSLFLSEFVASTPWAHLDIAGPMDSDGDEGWLNRGATAFGTRLLIDFVANFTKPPARTR